MAEYIVQNVVINLHMKKMNKMIELILNRYINTDVGIAVFSNTTQRYNIKKGNKKVALHREVYKEQHGEIPKNMEIHHIDGNRYNDHADNLIAVDHDTHIKLHQNMEQNKYHITINNNTLQSALAHTVCLLA